jgi:membrane protease YdiL (CAAX protease family)
VPWRAATERFVSDLVFVALPEEYFFRGVLQPSLERKGGPRRRLLGAPFGRGVVIAAALFALAHVLFQPELRRLAVFFPALWFGWLRSRTGSLAPGIVAHALANAVEVACFGAWFGSG